MIRKSLQVVTKIIFFVVFFSKYTMMSQTILFLNILLLPFNYFIFHHIILNHNNRDNTSGFTWTLYICDTLNIACNYLVVKYYLLAIIIEQDYEGS